MPDPLIIQAGTLRHLISILAPSSTRDAAGQPISTWTTVLTTRASIVNSTPGAYKQPFAGNILAAESTDFITLRYPAVDIQPGMRVAFGDNLYIIQAVDNVQRRNRVLILAAMVLDGDSE